MTTPRAKSSNPLPLRDRMKIPRQHMLEQEPGIRATNFTEVNLGYSPELARQEALRCLECAQATCSDKCPVAVKIPEFVALIVAGDYLGAAAKIREDNVLPAITGRVCPQEDHCEIFWAVFEIDSTTARRSFATIYDTSTEPEKSRNRTIPCPSIRFENRCKPFHFEQQ